MSNILLVNDNVQDYQTIINACRHDTYAITYNEKRDTYDSIFEKYENIVLKNNIQLVNHLALVSHGSNNPEFTFLEKENKMLISQYLPDISNSQENDTGDIDLSLNNLDVSSHNTDISLDNVVDLPDNIYPDISEYIIDSVNLTKEEFNTKKIYTIEDIRYIFKDTSCNILKPIYDLSLSDKIYYTPTIDYLVMETYYNKTDTSENYTLIKNETDDYENSISLALTREAISITTDNTDNTTNNPEITSYYSPTDIEDVLSESSINTYILNNLYSWNAFKEFIKKFNIQTSLDFLGCALLQSSDWKYTLETLETVQHLNLNIRASDDNTGNLKVGGDWILETDNVNIKDLYFTKETIENWDFLLAQLYFFNLAAISGGNSSNVGTTNINVGETKHDFIVRCKGLLSYIDPIAFELVYTNANQTQVNNAVFKSNISGAYNNPSSTTGQQVYAFDNISTLENSIGTTPILYVGQGIKISNIRTRYNNINSPTALTETKLSNLTRVEYLELQSSSVVWGENDYINPGNYTWTCPTGITAICVVCCGGGGGGMYYPYGSESGKPNYTYAMNGGGGGGLGWKNNITVVPGTQYSVKVGSGGATGIYNSGATAGGSSYFSNSSIVRGSGGGAGRYSQTIVGGGYAGDGGGSGGSAYNTSSSGKGPAGGGGAGGYTGNGGDGIQNGGSGSISGSGGGGAGGSCGDNKRSSGGGGVGRFGEGTSGSIARAGGSGGGSGGSAGNNSAVGGSFGGGGGGNSSSYWGVGGNGKGGFVRIIWGAGRSFPNTNTNNQTGNVVVEQYVTQSIPSTNITFSTLNYLMCNTIQDMKPTMTITAEGSTGKTVNSNNSTGDSFLNFTFTSTQPTSDFVLNDIDVTSTSGSMSNFIQSSSTIYTARFTPTSLSPATHSIRVNQGAYINNKTTIGCQNNATTQFNWTWTDELTIEMANTNLTDNNLNAMYNALTGAGGTMYNINSNMAYNKNNISDGGNDIYDGGNRILSNIKTSTADAANYSNNLVAWSGIGGNRYFVKIGPNSTSRFFILVMDLFTRGNGSTSTPPTFIRIYGNLGADGQGSRISGNTGGFYNTSTFWRVYWTSVHDNQVRDPSLHHIWIVKDGVGATFTNIRGTNTSFEDEQLNLPSSGGVNRLYYIMWCGLTNDGHTNVTEVIAVTSKFLEVVGET